LKAKKQQVHSPKQENRIRYSNIFVFLREYAPNLLRPKRSVLILILLTTLNVTMSLIVLVFPYLSKVTVDEAIRYKSLPLFKYLATCFAFLTLSRILLDIASSFVNTKTEVNMQRLLRASVFNRLADLPMEVQRSREYGNVSRRITNDIATYSGNIISAVPIVFGQLITFICLCFIIGNIHKTLFLLMAISIPSILLINVFMTFLLRRIVIEKQRVEDKLVNTINITSEGFVSLISFGVIKKVKKIFSELLDCDVNLTLQTWRFGIWKKHIEWLVSRGVGIVALWVAWYLVLRGRITIGWAIASLMYFGLVLEPIARLAGVFQAVQAAAIAADRLLELTRLSCNASNINNMISTTKTTDTKTNSIILKNISFHYPDSTRNVLDNLSFELPLGEVVGLCGPSGAGKTTLAKIIAGHFKPSQGNILYPKDLQPWQANINGENQKILYLPSEIFILPGSIIENIIFFSSESDQKRVLESIESASMKDFLPNLPEDLKSTLGQDNNNYSFGQLRRLMIARALYALPRLIILDEPTSGIDQKTERNIITNLLKIVSAKNLSILFITHRKTVVEHLDKIFYLVSEDNIIETQPDEIKWDSYWNNTKSEIISEC